MNQFDLEKLTVWHRLRDATGAGMREGLRVQLQRNTFYVATCMREFSVAYDANAALINADNDRMLCRLTGQDAYAFLLRTLTGLNSTIRGETNIQGQVRKAWDGWRHKSPEETVAALNPVMHGLFADSRVIRRQYLEGIGGTSYGSLVRKILSADADAKILFVGAGDLARSIAPYFNNRDTAVWNRHATDATAVGVQLAFAPDASRAASDWATHIVITTPPDSHNDAHWVKLLMGQTAIQHIVHLGLRRAQRGGWQGFQLCKDLDDLIELRQTQSAFRNARLEQAEQACDRLAASYTQNIDAIFVARAA